MSLAGLGEDREVDGRISLCAAGGDLPQVFDHAANLYQDAYGSFQHGRKTSAAEKCRAILAKHPRHAESLHLLGVLSYEAHHLEIAERLLRKATALARVNPHYHSNLGGSLQALGKLDAAAFRYRHAIALLPAFAEAHFNLGNLLRSQGKQSAAIESFQRAVAARPDMYQAYTNLGNILQSNGDCSAAESCYEKALAICPHSPEAHSNLGNLRRAENRLEEAVAQYHLALLYGPDFADAYTNLGTVLYQQEKLEEAVACQEKAIALRPDFAEAHQNLGCVLQAQGHTDAAMERYLVAIALKPGYGDAHFGIALIQLLRGQYTEGWKAYEARWQSDHQTRRWRELEQPLWRGERLPSGQLLLWGEQGVGDEIFFAGLFPDAIATGNECVVECDPRLVPLFARSFRKATFVASQPSQMSRFAAHLPMGSLPGLFRTTASCFPSTNVPYLLADPIAAEVFRARYQDGRRTIGLAWRSRNAKSGMRRSIELSVLALLFTRTDVCWVSLQYGDPSAIEAESEAVGAPMLVDRSIDQIDNLDTFAAQVMAMDLVITIDNSTAHLAAALGVPVWVMLPFASDWRWLEERVDCPWYPSMRLFRQPAPGEWQDVVRNVDHQLDDLELGSAQSGLPD